MERRNFYVPNKTNMKYLTSKTIEEQDQFFDAIIAKLLLNDYVAIMSIDNKSGYQLLRKLPITDENSSVFGSIDYIEYVFYLVVFKEQDKQ